MDKISKALRRFSATEREAIKIVLNCLKSGRLVGLDIKKLKGRSDIFRIRKGDIRIIYRETDGDIFILAIERRKEKTYKL